MTAPAGWQGGGLTAAETFGSAEIEPERLIPFTEYVERRKAELDPPGDLWDGYAAAPELDLRSIELEIGARCLLGIPADAPPPMIVDRLDPIGHTVLFGTGGSGKGTEAAWWIVQMARQGLRVLIVDYENHPDEWARRVGALGGDEALERVSHVAPLTAAWTLERGPLWQQARILRAFAEAAAIDVLVIDSIVVACFGFDPMAPETPGLYAGGLELIGRPALSLAHVTKTEDLRYPFGSVMWHNLARTTWSLKKDGERAILSHRKRNNYAGLGRFAVTTTWRDDLPREVWEQPYSAVLADRIADVLGDEQLTLVEIVDRLNADVDEDGEPVKLNSARRALARGIREPQRFTIDGAGASARYRKAGA